MIRPINVIMPMVQVRPVAEVRLFVEIKPISMIRPIYVRRPIAELRLAVIIKPAIVIWLIMATLMHESTFLSPILYSI